MSKTKIPNYLIWSWNQRLKSGIPGIIISAIQSLGSDKYKFKNAGRVRYNLLRTETKLESAFADIEKLRVNLVKEAMEAQSKEVGDAKELSGKHLEDFQNTFNQTLQTEDEYDIRTVKYSELDMDTNNIPNDILRPLMDTVIEDDTPKE